jgi:hypothetical protein
MSFGAEIWGPPLIAAGASWLSGQGNAGKETKMEKRKRKLVDQLITSLGGDGPFSDLYSSDQDVFQKSFVDPAKAIFNNQIAPQIQQQYIASGQQRGSGLDDQLLRAGVDLDQMLNQQMYQFNNDALNRKQGSINSILGSGSGAQNTPSGMQDIFSGLGGYLSSNDFAQQSKDLFKPNSPTTTAPPQAPNAIPQRKGYEPAWSDWKVGDPRWGG